MSNAAREDTRPTTYNVLFVCTGNTCRSPLAEALARREIERRGWRHVEVRSAGTGAEEGAPASEGAIAAASELGLDLSRHTSRATGRDLVEWADIILAMGPSHLRLLEQIGGAKKAALLGDFVAGGEGEGDPVPDPFGGDLQTYRDTLAELKLLVSQALDRISPIVHP